MIRFREFVHRSMCVSTPLCRRNHRSPGKTPLCGHDITGKSYCTRSEFSRAHCRDFRALHLHHGESVCTLAGPTHGWTGAYQWRTAQSRAHRHRRRVRDIHGDAHDRPRCIIPHQLVGLAFFHLCFIIHTDSLYRNSHVHRDFHPGEIAHWVIFGASVHQQSRARPRNTGAQWASKRIDTQPFSWRMSHMRA